MGLASLDEYGVGIVCALPKEMLAAQAMLDPGHEVLKTQDAGDSNSYVVGQVHGHKVVIACLPIGAYGSVAAATVAAHMLRTFRGIQIGLLVGIGGGIPEPKDDGVIRLGDVVISQPCDTHGGVVQHDQGKDVGRGEFVLKGFHNRPPTALLTALSTLQASPGTTRRHLRRNISVMVQKAAAEDDGYEFPGLDRDVLFCARCDRSEWTLWHWLTWMLLFWLYPLWLCQLCYEQRIPRSQTHDGAEVHYGIIASGNVLLKNRHERDRLRVDFGAKCIEMEAAGLMNDFPCLVIRGICDYADSHKNDDWQKYAAITAAAFAELLLSNVSPAEIYEVQRAAAMIETAHFSVPMKQKVRSFFGREDELRKITSYFEQTCEKNDRPRMLVLHAMGGQGKSQIALEYCHSVRKTCKAIFWIDGNSTLAMTRSFVGIAQQLDPVACASLSNDEAKVNFVMNTLGRWTHRWLLVYDNCDDASTFSELQDSFLLYVGHGSILFTSRHRGLEELGDIIEIPPMPHQAGIRLLLHRYANVNVDDYFAEGSEIVNRLGNLALAIDQASAYMHYTCLPIDKLGTFLPTYLARREKVLQHTAQHFWKYGKVYTSSEHETALAAFTTWEMSFQQLLENEPNSKGVAHFLTLSAFFGLQVNESIFRLHWEHSTAAKTWMNIFTKSFLASTNQNGSTKSRDISPIQDDTGAGLSKPNGQSQLNDRSASWEPDYFWRYIHQAFQLSLLESISRTEEANGASFMLHPLIRDWLQLRVTLKQRRMYTRKAAAVLTSSIRVYLSRGSDADIKAATLLHMAAILACDAEFFASGSGLGSNILTCSTVKWFAIFFRHVGQYDASLRLSELEKSTRTRVQGADHPNTLTSINRIALVLHDQGNYSEAEQLYRQGVAVRGRVLGNEHPGTLTSMNNLAGVLNDQGKYSEAESIHRQVVAIRERLLTEEHPNTLMSMNNLADVLSGQGKYGEAEPLHRQAVVGRERVLGNEHPDTLMSMDNLALVLDRQGKYSEAEPIHRQVVAVSKRVLGNEHPSTLMSMNNLAGVLRDQGKYSEAELIHRQVVVVRKRVLGNEHPNTLMSMDNLALLLNGQGKYSEAEPIHRQVVAVSKRVLGNEHPSTLKSMNNLAGVLRNQGKGRLSEAELIYRQVAVVRERILGNEHPDTLTSRNNLALVLYYQKKYSEAEPIHRQVGVVRERVLGKEHPSTLTSRNNLALVLYDLGKLGEAEEIHRQVVVVEERILGKGHPNTLTSMNNLADVLRDQGNLTEAERIQRQVAKSSYVMLGTKHPKTKKRLDELVRIWKKQGRQASEIEDALQIIREDTSSPSE